MSVARRGPIDLAQAVFNEVYRRLQGVNLIDSSQEPQNKLTDAQSADTKYASAEIAKIATLFAIEIQLKNPPVYRQGSGAGAGSDGTHSRSLSSDEMDELNRLFAEAFPT